MMTWIKRILGFAITIAVPFVTQRYGAAAGSTLAVAGGAVLHQVDKFGPSNP